MMATLITTVFILGYLLIALEHFVRINKSAIAILTGVLCWTLFMFSASDRVAAAAALEGHVSDIAGILFFLMGAMTIVEIIDAHDGFATVTSLLGRGSRLRLLWLVGIVSFFLSAVLDNMTTAIVMVSLLMKLCPKREDLLMFAGVVIVAVNAGGAWTPIGDVTTTMLWIGGQITTLSIMKKLFLPSIACIAVPLMWLSLRMKNGSEGTGGSQPKVLEKRERRAGQFVFFLGVGSLLFVPVFKSLTHLPPFVGMMFGLGVIWIVTEIMHRKSSEAHYHSRSVVGALTRIDMPSILFFLGILLCVSALQTAGVLAALASWLDRTVGNIDVIVIAIGVLSVIVDNVPLVAAGIRMYPLSLFPTDHHFWSFLSYCAGTGGSLLVIGSAAGVVAMGMAKIDFFWYMRRIAPLAVAGYIAGAAVYLVQLSIFK
jgi:Na+/H+ antiporter NhaD/arsenite permease-like protein